MKVKDGNGSGIWLKLGALALAACFVLAVTVTVFSSSGCKSSPKKGDLPLYPLNIDPPTMLRLMDKRAYMLGGVEADLDITVKTSSKANFTAGYAYNAPSEHRLQIAYPGEPPVIDSVVRGRSAEIYSPVELVKLTANLDLAVADRMGILWAVEAASFFDGQLTGFVPYGAKIENDHATQFVFLRDCPSCEIRAFVHRETQTIRKMVYSNQEGVLFETSYDEYVTVRNTVWPMKVAVAAEGFEMIMKTDSFRFSTHSITDFILDELPGTEEVFSVGQFLGVLYGKDSLEGQ
ncbi:MAG: hypothetical protein U5N86_03045 [Planctomycetota bacterium]|nr:hypothetical protein [Planctomycetota bacterium]